MWMKSDKLPFHFTVQAYAKSDASKFSGGGATANAVKFYKRFTSKSKFKDIDDLD